MEATADVRVSNNVLIAGPLAGGLLPDEGPSQRSQQEAAAVHAGMVGPMARQGATPHGHPNSRISASAFSSQYAMPMSQYIAVALTRCSWACSRLYCAAVELAKAEMAVGDERPLSHLVASQFGSWAPGYC